MQTCNGRAELSPLSLQPPSPPVLFLRVGTPFGEAGTAAKEAIVRGGKITSIDTHTPVAQAEVTLCIQWHLMIRHFVLCC